MRQSDLIFLFLLFLPAINLGQYSCLSYNIILITVQNLGFNDVGFHGHSDIPTPNIDALAYSGIILNNYYVSPSPKQSIGALMSGKYPIHTGTHNNHTKPIGKHEKLLPQILVELGYKNYLLAEPEVISQHKFKGFNYTLDLNKLDSLNKSAHAIKSKILREADKLSQPIFMHISYDMLNSEKYFSPEEEEKFSYIKDCNRRKYAVILTQLDNSIGVIVQALHDSIMLRGKNYIIFTTTNGAPVTQDLNYGANYPLKGGKGTVWEGGVRGAAFIWSTALLKHEKNGKVSNEMMHITDWMPTILNAICHKEKIPKSIDGLEMWETLFHNRLSLRSEILHDMDATDGKGALTYLNWKLVTGYSYSGPSDGWSTANITPIKYDYMLVKNSVAAQSLYRTETFFEELTMKRLKESVTVNCEISTSQCDSTYLPCLFDLDNDPCEYYNVAERYPQIVQGLRQRIDDYSPVSKDKIKRKRVRNSADSKQTIEIWFMRFITFCSIYYLIRTLSKYRSDPRRIKKPYMLMQ